MRAYLRVLGVVLLTIVIAPSARAGLYYSGETVAELPSQWRGFLVDQRLLRGIAVKPAAGTPANAARLRYEEAAAKLAKTATQRALTARRVLVTQLAFAHRGEHAVGDDLVFGDFGARHQGVLHE